MTPGKIDLLPFTFQFRNYPNQKEIRKICRRQNNITPEHLFVLWGITVSTVLCLVMFSVCNSVQ